MMKVLFITHCNNMGGANRALLELILELRKVGVSSDVVLPKTRMEPEYGLRNELEKHNINYTQEYYFWYRVNCLQGFIRYISNIIWYPRIIWKLRKNKYDIIHSNSSFTDLGVWLSLTKKTPHIWHLREYGNWGGSRPALGKIFDRILASKASFGLAISNAQSQYYLPLFPKGKIKVVYDGVEERGCEKISDKSTENKVFNFCMVGNLCEGKNQMMAIQSLNELRGSKEFNRIHLTFIGGGLEYKKILESEISKLSLDKNITFLGEVNDVDFYLKNMDCGLILTKNEAFGRVTVEYMLHELAVIATDSGANPEIVVQGETGDIVKQDDFKELSKIMISYVKNREKVLNMGKNGRTRALELFTSSKNAMNVKSVYNSILSD